MYPEDRVLVAPMPHPADFRLLQTQGWYRIPYRSAPKGLYAELYAFYFGGAFGAQKWAIHATAQRLGHELVRRRDLFPDQPDHPRADDWYYRVQLGPVQFLERPIISLQWRRITFLHTTWDRFREATEINDLFLDGDAYVDRAFSVLRDGRSPRNPAYTLKEAAVWYAA
jgi:hypothetical protein